MGVASDISRDIERLAGAAASQLRNSTDISDAVIMAFVSRGASQLASRLTWCWCYRWKVTHIILIYPRTTKKLTPSHRMRPVVNVTHLCETSMAVDTVVVVVVVNFIQLNWVHFFSLVNLVKFCTISSGVKKLKLIPQVTFHPRHNLVRIWPGKKLDQIKPDWSEVERKGTI